VLIATGRTHSAAGEVVVMEPAYPSEDSVPSRPGQAETGGTEGAADEGRDAPTMNQPASPRQGAGPAALPDDEPGTVEPSAMGANAPGLHERTETADG
jgi:hypothetical protein